MLMPQRMHLLLTPANDVTLERAIQLIKGGSAYPDERTSATEAV
jgi:hypothetical protein